MASILDQIVDTKWREIFTNRARVPEPELERLAAGLPPARDFAGALDRPGEVRVIAEVKKASPSAGVIRADFDPVAIATTYERHGAACVSVLTDAPYFQGSLDHLSAVRTVVGCPLLRKDFILERYQLLEARIAGADAALLIAEVLPGDQLTTLHREATALGLDVLVELHDADRLRHVYGGRLVLREEQPLRRDAVRHGTLEQGDRLFEQDLQSFRRIDAGRLDETEVDRHKLRTAPLDDTVTDALKTGVDPEHPHRLNLRIKSDFGITTVIGRPWGHK